MSKEPSGQCVCLHPVVKSILIFHRKKTKYDILFKWYIIQRLNINCQHNEQVCITSNKKLNRAKPRHIPVEHHVLVWNRLKKYGGVKGTINHISLLCISRSQIPLNQIHW